MPTVVDLPMCLSVRQPWAHWLVVGDAAGDHHGAPGFKNIENRTWSTEYRGPLLIHASKGVDPGNKRLVNQRGMQLGGIIGVVDLVDVITSDDDNSWWIGPYGLVVENPRRLPFMPCNGTIAPLLWPVPLELRSAVEEALAAA